MSNSRARKRFFESWIDIVLTTVSIIQGLAFNDLVVRLPSVYDYTISSGQYAVAAHFVLCFVILLRIFQTYIAAALDYEEWSVSFFDVLFVFMLGAVEFFVFSSLVTPDFNIIAFHMRISIISILGILGYIGALVRIKEEQFPSYYAYRTETRLQAVNIIGVLTVQAISIFIIFSPHQTDFTYSILASVQSFALAFNIYYSLRITFNPNIRIEPSPNPTNPNGNNTAPTPSRPEVIIRVAERSDLIELLNIMMENFSYVYISLLDTSDKLTRSILKSVFVFNGGQHSLGYKAFNIAFDKSDGKILGLIMIYPNEFTNLFHKSVTVFSWVIVVMRYLGIIGLFRVLINSRSVSTAIPEDIRNGIHISYFAVKNSHQKLGIGKQMIDYVRTIAKAKGKEYITLDVREKDHGAFEFFQKQGFEKDSIIESKSDILFGHGHRIRMKLQV